jgi:hypothetical protein
MRKTIGLLALASIAVIPVLFGACSGAEKPDENGATPNPKMGDDREASGRARGEGGGGK